MGYNIMKFSFQSGCFFLQGNLFLSSGDQVEWWGISRRNLEVGNPNVPQYRHCGHTSHPAVGHISVTYTAFTECVWLQC